VVMVLDRLTGTTERIGPGFDVALTSNGRHVAFTEVADTDVIGPGRITGFGLPKGIENSFTTKVDAAIRAVERGDLAATCGSLGALANHARAQAAKKLMQAQADQIVAEARAVAALLGCS
jgi:hypothetical protein